MKSINSLNNVEEKHQKALEEEKYKTNFVFFQFPGLSFNFN